MELYRRASVYDILHSPGTGRELRALLRIAGRRGVPPVERLRCFEPACGSGRLLRALARRGATVYGCDLEPAMLAYARTRMPKDWKGRLVTRDMRDPGGLARAGSIDLAFNLINSVRHLESDAALRDHFRGVTRLLRPGGIYVVGISLSRYGQEAPTEDLWTGTRGRCRVDQLVQYLPPEGPGTRERFETVVSVLSVRRPSGTDELTDRYRLRAYDEEQWEAAVARSPLRVVERCGDDGEAYERCPWDYRLYVLSP